MANLRRKLQSRKFVVTAEITPPVSASAGDLLERALPLKGVVDAVNVTDAPSARATMGSLASAAILAANQIEPVLQFTCRDRNRIALAGDLLGASAVGVRNILVLHGDDPRNGDMPDATPVYDLDSRGIMSMARQMRDESSLPSGREIVTRPDFFIGCADAPFDPPGDWEPTGLAGKIEAGAQFAQTQFCFDLEIARRYFARLVDFGVTERLDFIVGVGPLLSLRQARFMDEKLFGVSVPDAIMARMEGADDEKAEGQAICAELIAGLGEIEGVAGVHIMAPMQPAEAIAETVALSGIA